MDVDTPGSEDGTLYVDILQMEVDQNLPHWLHEYRVAREEAAQERKL